MEAMASNADIIPVGREPERVDGPNESRALHENNTRKDGAGGTHERALSNKSSRSPIRDPERFYKYKNALEESRVFREFTMRALKRRAELAVWLAIHGCQHCGRAQISQKRIAELAGIKGKRHVVNAIQGLRKKGLLEVVVKGHYRPNGVEEHGLSSVYRVYPRPEPRLLEKVRAEEQEEPGPIAGKDMGDFEKRSPK
jgi:hypothetical protein